MLGQNQRRVALTLRELLRNASYGEDQNLVTTFQKNNFPVKILGKTKCVS